MALHYLTDYAAAGARHQLVTTSSGSTTLTGTFTSDDVGKNIVIRGGASGGGKFSTTIASYVDSSTVQLTTAPTATVASTYAAIGFDCSTELQEALDTIASEGGGTLVIDGEFLLTGTVFKNFNLLASSVRVVGYGSSSALFIAVPGVNSAITLANLQGKLVIEGIDFVGTPGEAQDMRFAIDLQACLNVDIRDNGFYGLANTGTVNDSGVILSNGGGLNLSGNLFGGCITGKGGVVLNTAWLHFSSQDNRFIDFGQRGSILHSKTPLVTGSAWINVGEAVPSSSYEDSAVTSYAHATVDIRGDIYDEGTKNHIFVSSPNKRILGVSIADCRFNVNGWTTGTTGPAILNVSDVKISHCSFGYTHEIRYAIYLNTVKHARLEGLSCNGIVTAIKAYTMDWLEIVNSPTLTRDLTSVTRTSIDGVNV